MTSIAAAVKLAGNRYESYDGSVAMPPRAQRADEGDPLQVAGERGHVSRPPHQAFEQLDGFDPSVLADMPVTSSR